MRGGGGSGSGGAIRVFVFVRVCESELKGMWAASHSASTRTRAEGGGGTNHTHRLSTAAGFFFGGSGAGGWAAVHRRDRSGRGGARDRVSFCLDLISSCDVFVFICVTSDGHKKHTVVVRMVLVVLHSELPFVLCVVALHKGYMGSPRYGVVVHAGGPVAFRGVGFGLGRSRNTQTTLFTSKPHLRPLVFPTVRSFRRQLRQLSTTSTFHLVYLRIAIGRQRKRRC